jgi:hypothetical protein
MAEKQASPVPKVVVVNCDIVGIRYADAGCAASAVWHARGLHLAVCNIVKLDAYATETPTAKVDISNYEVRPCIAY